MPLKWKRRAELANNDLAVLEKQCETSHGFVSVKTSPPGAMIFVDGVKEALTMTHCAPSA